MKTLRAATIAVVLAGGLAGCGGDDGRTAPTAENDTTAPTAGDPADAASTTTASAGPACGVSLADVEALLPPASGVTENSTTDPGRCNFTWDDGGPRGIDVAIVPGGRSSFDVPAGYEPLDGYGNEAFASANEDRASAFAFVGDDLYAADVVTDGTGAAEAELRVLCLRLLDLTLS